jgi:hypothetical protein
MDKKELDSATLRVINLLVIKNTWKVYRENYKDSKEKDFFSFGLITKHHYQDAMRGGEVKYNDKKIKAMNISHRVLTGEKLLVDDDYTLKIYEGIKKYIDDKANGEDTDRSIQSYETKIRTYIRYKKIDFEDNPIKCNPIELRNLFTFFRYGKVSESDYEMRIIEEALNAVSIDQFIKNIDDIEILKRHEAVVDKYWRKLHAVITLQEDILKMR